MWQPSRGSNSHTHIAESCSAHAFTKHIHTIYTICEKETHIYSPLFAFKTREYGGGALSAARNFFKGLLPVFARLEACAERRSFGWRRERERANILSVTREVKNQQLGCRQWLAQRSDDAGPLVCDSSYLLSLYWLLRPRRLRVGLSAAKQSDWFQRAANSNYRRD